MDMDNTEVEPWFVTVVRAHGLKQIRPEKTWRPIVTVEIDQHYCYELALGVDGQNPNLKDRFAFPDADLSARVEIKVWHCPPTKKKSKKKRQLVACASCTLGELVKRQEVEPRIEVQLQCQSTKNSKSSRGKAQSQSRPSLHLHLQPPSPSRQNEPPDSGYVSDSHQSSTASSDRSTTPPPSPILTTPQNEYTDETNRLLGGLGLRRRRKQRPYFLDSEEERNYETEYESDSSSSSSTCLDLTKSSSATPSPSRPIYISLPLTNSVLNWLAPSLLPQYTETEQIEVKETKGWARRVVGSFTMYEELRDACAESDYECVFRRIVMEWSYVGGLLVALAAVDTAVFAISPDTVFNVDSWAQLAIAGSSVASGLGIACDAWFLVRYGWVDAACFASRARDIFDSYFFFSISSRVPALCMLASSVCLMVFLGLVAYEVFPVGVLIISFLVGLTMTLQFLVYGVHWTGMRVVRSVRVGKEGVRQVVRRVSGRA
ncbi:hypothetical protein BDQ17DRAFT_538122 [Cyathus striatus]|nr:hypothetical protein BDQ17DRAFT_538122 [Cyathus striatus]